MRKYQLLHLSIRRDRANDGGRHVESPLHSGGALWHGIMGDEYVCV